jgi:uncharacterized protein (TIGR00661 family)
MKIAYGVHGYGRGHAMRALAMLPRLRKRHEVLVLAGGDAYSAITPEFSAIRIPRLSYHYDRKGRLSAARTLKRNIAGIVDNKTHGPIVEYVRHIFEEFQPDVVLSDSEPFTLHAAKQMKIGRISFDHFGLLVYGRPEMNWFDRMNLRRDAAIYKYLMGGADRYIVTAFFSAPSKREGVRAVGPVIRDAVRKVTPVRGDYLLVYFSKGEHEFTPQVEKSLKKARLPARVYGVPREGVDENLEFKPFSNEIFINDLAGCRAVVATTGNQLIGEVIYFGKPMLGLPHRVLEQRLNAHYVERMGVGLQTTRERITPQIVRQLLDREQEFAANAKREFRDGAAEACDAVDEFAAELAPNAGSG